MEYPKEALIYATQGTEIVQFEVSADGKLADFEIINSVSPYIDKAVYDFLKTTCAMWKPGENNGEPVSMRKEISIKFEMDNTNDFEAIANTLFKKRF